MSRGFEIAGDHEEWLELCALATGGALEPDERQCLRAHLSDCPQCHDVMAQYRMLGCKGMPLVADEFAPADDELIEPPGWEISEALRELFERLDAPSSRAPARSTPSTFPAPPRGAGVRAPVEARPGARPGAWPGAWIGVAACIAITACVISYGLGRRSAPLPQSLSPSLLAQVQSLADEKMALDRRLSAESAELVSLERQTSDRQDEIGRLKGRLDSSQSQLDSSRSQLGAITAAKQATDQELQSAGADRDHLAAKLEAAQQAYQVAQRQLADLETERRQNLLHSASLETEVNDLTRRLHESDARVDDDTRYLASDRDIRELMGARQLYIADVVDVDQNGDRRKPFGRVFYTRGRSLVFYAFDLDRQGGMRRASTFQAWAREGSDKARPVSLGIFYVDSETNRRWALKASDPKLLAEINSVFVTAEPEGGSQNPTGRPLLYAYLRTETPNHP